MTINRYLMNVRVLNCRYNRGSLLLLKKLFTFDNDCICLYFCVYILSLLDTQNIKKYNKFVCREFLENVASKHGS